MSEWVERNHDITAKENDGTTISVAGFTYRGIGLHCYDPDCPDDWTVTHLASGMQIGGICASPDRLFVVATALADAFEWESFDTRDGWKDTVPDLLWVLGDVWLQFSEELEVPCLPWSYVSPDEVQTMH